MAIKIKGVKMSKRKGQTRKQKVATRGHINKPKKKKIVVEPKDTTDQIVEASKFDPSSVVANILKKEKKYK